MVGECQSRVRLPLVALRDEGATIAEYALVLGVIALVAATGAVYFGQQLHALFAKFIIP